MYPVLSFKPCSVSPPPENLLHPLAPPLSVSSTKYSHPTSDIHQVSLGGVKHSTQHDIKKSSQLEIRSIHFIFLPLSLGLKRPISLKLCTYPDDRESTSVTCIFFTLWPIGNLSSSWVI